MELEPYVKDLLKYKLKNNFLKNQTYLYLVILM